MPFDNDRFDAEQLERLAQQANQRQRKCEDGDSYPSHDVLDSAPSDKLETAGIERDMVHCSENLSKEWSQDASGMLSDSYKREADVGTATYGCQSRPLLPNDNFKVALDIVTLNDAALSYCGEPGDFLFTKRTFQVLSNFRATGSGNSPLLDLVGDAIPAWPVSRLVASAVGRSSAHWADVLTSFTSERSHVLLLDEPTNHSDPSPFDTLACSIKDYEGGVVIVSDDASRCARQAGEGVVVMDLDEPVHEASAELRARLERQTCVCIVSRDFRPMLQAISEAIKCLREADENATREGLSDSRIGLSWPERARWLVNKPSRYP